MSTVTHEKEFRHLVRLEQRLQNAMSELRVAEELGEGRMLRERIRAGREQLEQALTLAARVKHAVLDAWRLAEGEQRAA